MNPFPEGDRFRMESSPGQQPKFVLLRSMFGSERLTRLNALKASTRNSVLSLDVMLNRFESERLTSA